MALTKADKDFIHLSISGVNARMDANHEIVNLQLTGINEKLTKQNGRVAKLEERVDARDTICATVQAVKSDNEKSKYWKVIGYVIGTAILASLITNIGIFEFLKLLK
jgi:tetrahydromethanopterin S-methyltransferase subunit B